MAWYSSVSCHRTDLAGSTGTHGGKCRSEPVTCSSPVGDVGRWRNVQAWRQEKSSGRAWGCLVVVGGESVAEVMPLADQ
jgi:hypothetical protein